MIRPFYRSRLFWLGMPGLVFLIWTWSAAKAPFGYLSYSTAKDQVMVQILSRKGFVVHRRPFPIVLPAAQRGFRIYRQDSGLSSLRDVAGASIPPAFTWRTSGRGLDRSNHGFIAYWFLFLLYLLFWFSLLFGWQRRKTRLMKIHAAPPP